MHTCYALAATPTGRLSSSEPNLQNIPIRTEEGRKIRRAFIATPGHKLVSADYSQIELRLLAEIADIAALQNAFRDGLDIHAMTASEMFGVPVKGMPGEVRRRAKAINFGIIYGISAFGLANQLGIEREEAGAYIRKYFERFPGIRDYMEETKAFAKKNGYVLTLFGRKCHYPDIAASNASIRAFNERAAINARLQGTAADIIRRAMARMDAALAKKKLNAQMLLQVHDELVFEVPDDEVEKTLPVVKEVMEDAPMPALSLSVPLAGRRPRRAQLGRGALRPLRRTLDYHYRAADDPERRLLCGPCPEHHHWIRMAPCAGMLCGKSSSLDCSVALVPARMPRRARRRRAALAVGAAVPRHPAHHRDRPAAVPKHLAPPLRQARLRLGGARARADRRALRRADRARRASCTRCSANI